MHRLSRLFAVREGTTTPAKDPSPSPSLLSIARRALRVGAAALGMSFLLGTGATAQEVIPDFYKEPGINPNRSYVNQNFNEHIDPFSGGLQLHYTDIHIPGNGKFDLSVIRSYNSSSVAWLNPAIYDSLAGVGWNVHFGRVLKKSSDICNTSATTVASNPVVEMPDGGRHLLAFTGGTAPLALSNQRWRADCFGSGAGMTVYSPDGTRYDMNHMVNVSVGPATMYAWYTTRITDRNGNFATVNYASGASPEITSITTNDGRSVSFTYADSGLASRRILTITGPSQTYNYGYTAIAGVTGKYFLTSVTRPGGTSWGYAYNGEAGGAAGAYLLNQVTYPEGGRINYTYDFVYFDSSSNPMSRSSVVKTKTLSSGGTWSFAYTPGSFNVYDTTTVTTPSGTIVYKHIGPNYSSSGTVWMVGLLMSKQIGSIHTETNTWTKQKVSSQNNMRPGAFLTKVDTGEVNVPVLSSRTIVRDGATHSTTFSAFDTYGNPGTITETGPNGGNRTTTVTYFINASKWIINQVKDQTVSGGVSITRSFDTNGNMLSVTQDGISTGYTYDGQGNVATTTFPRSLTHTYTNYKRGIAQTETQREGVGITRVVSDAGNITSETNGESKTTNYGYDGLNRVTSIAPPAGSPISISYTATSKTATRGSLVETTNYDGFARPLSITLGGISRTYQHDALGRITFASNPGASVGTNYLYDMLDRVTRETNADSSFKRYDYGAGTRTVTDENSKATTYSYRSYGDPGVQLLMGVSAPESSASITITRNGKDLVTNLLQGGIGRGYGYNAAGYLTSVTNPEIGTMTYGRDDAGNMTTRSVGTSGATTLVYDGQNRLTSITYPSGTPNVTKTYTKTNKLKTLTSSSASRVYGYDANDNLTSESLTVDGLTFAVGYGYNGLDQLSTITYPRSNRVVSYAPNALGRPTQVSGFVTGVNYWPSGQVNQITYANGVVSSYGQNSRLWPSGFSTSKGTSIWINSTYGYDGVGNLKSASDTADSGFNRTLGYDGINRLTSASGPWGSGTMAYSGAGNLMSQSFGSFAIGYSYDGQNRLASVSGARAGSFSYDVLGNIVTAPGATYTYDAAPNLTCVNCADTAKKVAYTYDGLGRRVTTTKGGVKKYEVYGANGQLLAEYTASPSRLSEFIYLGGKRIAQVDTNSSVTTLTASPNPVLTTQAVTLTATVTGNSPTGTVTFRDGTTSIGTGTVSAGRATLAYTFTVAGTKSITATYGGDGNNDASTSAAVSLIVNSKPSSTTTLAVSPNPVSVGATVTMTATVTGASPTGSVTFMNGGTAVGTAPISAGKATYTTSFATAGSRSLTASYPGDANNGASVSSAVALNVITKANTTTSVGFSSNPVATGRNVTLTAYVSNGSSPTGTVTFRDGPTTLGTGTVSAGTATYTTSFPSAGTKSITASYAGDTYNNPSASSAASLTVVTPIATTTRLDCPLTSPVGVWLDCKVTVTPASAVNLTGNTVQMLEGGAVRGTGTLAYSSGYTANIRLAGLAVGSHTFEAKYLGGPSTDPSTSPTVSSTVNPAAATTTSWSGPVSNTIVGTFVDLKVRVGLTSSPNSLYCDYSKPDCSSSNPWYGEVQFLDGATVIATAPVKYNSSLPGFEAVYRWVPTVAGGRTITAKYLGIVPNAPSQVSAGLTVSPAVATVTSFQPALPPSIAVGTTITLTARVSAASSSTTLYCDFTQTGCGTATAPLGSVQFLDGSTVIGTAPVRYNSSGPRYEAILSWRPTTTGSRTLTARYLGTTPNAPSQGTFPLTVN